MENKEKKPPHSSSWGHREEAHDVTSTQQTLSFVLSDATQNALIFNETTIGCQGNTVYLAFTYIEYVVDGTAIVTNRCW